MSPSCSRIDRPIRSSPRSRNGEFFSEPAEGPGTYGLEGQMVGPGKVRGVIIRGPQDHPKIRIVDGRWGLDSSL